MNRQILPALLGIAVLLPTAPGAGAALMDELGDAVKDGDVRMSLRLEPGTVPLNASWDLRAIEETEAAILATAKDGKLQVLHFHVPDKSLMLVGHGLYPNIVLEDIDVEGGKGIADARFHGRGFGRLVVALFRRAAMKAVRRMKFHDDLASLFRGDILLPAEGSKPPEPPPGGEAAPAAAGKSGPGFFDLVRTLSIRDSSLTAFGGRRLDFEPAIAFTTAPGNGEALRVKIDSLDWSPARGGAASEFAMQAGFDGELGAGSMALHGDRLEFSKGHLESARLSLRAADQTSVGFSARALAVELSSGRFALPGGIRVLVDDGSKFSARDFHLAESGKISAVVDADIKGRTGEWERSGTTAAMEGVSLRAEGLALRGNRATGPVELRFDYRLAYPLVVKYPLPEIPERRVQLDFHGTLEAALDLQDAGGPDGRVRGEYSLRVPWAPVEKAALEVLRAKWTQDVRPVFRSVDFDVEPTEFGPCGTSCFLAKLNVTVDKKSGKTGLFHEECSPLGQAKLEIDKETRSVRLKEVRIEPHCKGAIGWVVNLVSPLFAKAYSDVTVLEMPKSFPLSVDEVRSGNDWIALAGKVDWEEKEEP